MEDLLACIQTVNQANSDPRQCDHILFAVHDSKTDPQWTPHQKADIRATKVYSEYEISNGYPAIIRGSIAGFIVVSQKASGWLVDDKNYWSMLRFATGHYCHGIVDRVMLKERIPASGNVMAWDVSNQEWMKALHQEDMQEFIRKIIRRYPTIHIGKINANGILIYPCKSISCRVPMGHLMVLPGNHKSCENRDAPLVRLKGYKSRVNKLEHSYPISAPPSTVNNQNDDEKSTNKKKKISAPSTGSSSYLDWALVETPHKQITPTPAKKLTKKNIDKVLTFHMDYNKFDLKKSKIILELVYNKSGETWKKRGKKRGGKSVKKPTMSKHYFYLDSIYGASRTAAAMGDFLKIIGADNWKKVKEWAINDWIMINGGKCQVIANCWYFFKEIGQVSINTMVGVMVDVKDYAVSSRKITELLYNKRGDMPWPYGPNDAAKMSFCYKKPSEQFEASDWNETDINNNSFIRLPIAELKRGKREGHGKRTGRLMNEACESINISIIFFPAPSSEQEQARKKEIEAEKTALQKKSLQHNNPMDDLQTLLAPTPTQNITDDAQKEPWMCIYDADHRYTDLELIELENDESKHMLYVAAIKYQHTTLFKQYKKDIKHVVDCFFDNDGGTQVNVDEQGDCGIDGPTISKGGSHMTGQFLMMKRWELVDYMHENKEGEQYYEILKDEYPNERLNPTQLLDKWKQPYVYLTLTHVIALAKMMKFNILVLMVVSRSRVLPRYYQFDKSWNDKVLPYYTYLNHWGRILFPNKSAQEIRAVILKYVPSSDEDKDMQIITNTNTETPNTITNTPNTPNTTNKSKATIPTSKPPTYTGIIRTNSDNDDNRNGKEIASNKNNKQIVSSKDNKEEWIYSCNMKYGLDWCTYNEHIQQELNKIVASVQIITDMQQNTGLINFRKEKQMCDSIHRSIVSVIEYGGKELLIQFLKKNKLDALGRMIWCVEEAYHMEYYKDALGLLLCNEFDIDVATEIVANDVINSMYIENIWNKCVVSLKNNSKIEEFSQRSAGSPGGSSSNVNTEIVSNINISLKNNSKIEQLSQRSDRSPGGSSSHVNKEIVSNINNRKRKYTKGIDDSRDTHVPKRRRESLVLLSDSEDNDIDDRRNRDNDSEEIFRDRHKRDIRKRDYYPNNNKYRSNVEHKNKYNKYGSTTYDNKNWSENVTCDNKNGRSPGGSPTRVNSKGYEDKYNHRNYSGIDNRNKNRHRRGGYYGDGCDNDDIDDRHCENDDIDNRDKNRHRGGGYYGDGYGYDYDSDDIANRHNKTYTRDNRGGYNGKHGGYGFDFDQRHNAAYRKRKFSDEDAFSSDRYNSSNSINYKRRRSNKQRKHDKYDDEIIKSVKMLQQQQLESQEQMQKIVNSISEISKAVARISPEKPKKSKGNKKKNKTMKKRTNTTMNNDTDNDTDNDSDGSSRSSSPKQAPSKIPMKLIARSLFEISCGAAYNDTMYYGICATRSCGINKYFKSPIRSFITESLRITQGDYNNLDLGAYCVSRKLGSLTSISQQGAKKAGYGSVHGFVLGVRQARDLLDDGLYQFLLKEKEEQMKSKENETK